MLAQKGRVGERSLKNGECSELARRRLRGQTLTFTRSSSASSTAGDTPASTSLPAADSGDLLQKTHGLLPRAGSGPLPLQGWERQEDLPACRDRGAGRRRPGMAGRHGLSCPGKRETVDPLLRRDPHRAGACNLNTRRPASRRWLDEKKSTSRIRTMPLSHS